MKNKEDICVVVQARLGSQRVPNKMIRRFDNGETLMTRIVDTLTDVDIPVYFSLYEEELKNHVIRTLATKVPNAGHFAVFDRSYKSANSEGTPMTEMYEWWDKLPYKYAVLVNACCPFLTLQTIEDFIDFYQHVDEDGAFGVIEKKNYFWNRREECLTPLTEAVMNTKTVEPTLEAAHALYGGRMASIGEGVWMGDFSKNEIALFRMKEKETFDIDYEWQWDFANKVISYK
jgi:CMP-N-acetylneuraminic acid synthetase